MIALGNGTDGPGTVFLSGQSMLRRDAVLRGRGERMVGHVRNPLGGTQDNRRVRQAVRLPSHAYRFLSGPRVGLQGRGVLASGIHTLRVAQRMLVDGFL